MGEAKRRGSFETRKQEAIQAAELEKAQYEAEQASREAAERANGTSNKQSKRSLMVSSMIAMAAANGCIAGSVLRKYL